MSDPLVEASRRRTHPDEPWLWRQDWSEGRADNALRRLLVRGWWKVAAGAVVAVGAVAALRAAGQPLRVVLAVAFAGAIIVLPGLIGMAIVSGGGAMARSTIRLDAVPVPLGGWLRGRIVLEGVLARGGQLLIAVRCVHVRPEGEQTTWEERLEPASSPTGRGGAEIPISVQIPLGCPETRMDGSCRWELLVHARTFEGRAVSRFDLPVFQV